MRLLLILQHYFGISDFANNETNITNKVRELPASFRLSDILCIILLLSCLLFVPLHKGQSLIVCGQSLTHAIRNEIFFLVYSQIIH